MNVKFRVCLLFLLLPLLAQGQEIGKLRLNPKRTDSGSAALWGGIEEGGFRPVYAASFQWSAGAEAQTVRHGKNSSWTGALSLENATGVKMKSSMLLEPGYFPLDILEFSGGMKSRQKVRLEAGFLQDFGDIWAAGVKASLVGMHSGKKQALPHSDFGMDLQLEPTLTFVSDEDAGIVSSYILRLRTERLQIKSAEGAGKAFLDKGLRYGEYLSDGQNVFPILEFSHGIAERYYSPIISVGVDWIWKRGQAGDAYRFPGSTVSVFVDRTIEDEKVDHTYHISYQRTRDQLRELLSGDGGFSSLSDRWERSANVKYEALFKNSFIKSLGISLDGSRSSERQIQATYDRILRNNGSAALLASFTRGFFDLDLKAEAGSGFWRSRGLAARDDAEAEPSRQLDDWYRKMDYLMAPRIGMGGTLTYRIPAVKGLYTQLHAYWLRGFKVTRLPGKNREIVTFKAGYNF